eukprot:TRINITY_DN8355_c0_g1_i1.p2 TRINITY_DN8355_c0_g1~~TRINITY_DN8355_c0_g1_i1.p2  ORF type:complete len:105 (+),score=25.76 TRINITY_DN8355_c0_g1_i1:355-669(+)
MVASFSGVESAPIQNALGALLNGDRAAKDAAAQLIARTISAAEQNRERLGARPTPQQMQAARSQGPVVFNQMDALRFLLQDDEDDADEDLTEQFIAQTAARWAR